MNALVPTVHGSFRSMMTSFAAKVMRLARPRRWRHRARASEVLDAVLATASDAVFFVDARGKVRDCNLVAEQLFGRDRSEVIGRGIALYLPSLAFSALRRRAKGLGHDSLSLEMPGRLETLATDSSGATFPVSVAVRSLTVWGNRGCIVRIRDDSRREADRQQIRRLTDQLEIAKTALERQNALFERQSSRRTDALRRFNELTASAYETKSSLSSQDLGEPLHRIIGQATTGKKILEQSPHEELFQCLESIETEAATMNILVNQLIQLPECGGEPATFTSESTPSAACIEHDANSEVEGVRPPLMAIGQKLEAVPRSV